MIRKSIEDLFINSFDRPLSKDEEKQLAELMSSDKEGSIDLKVYPAIREALKRKNDATFGPHFRQRVMAEVQKTKRGLDVQIGFFFRKFQLAAVSLLVVLFAANAMSSESLTLSSVLGIEDIVSVEEDIPGDETMTDEIVPDDDIAPFEFYENLNNIE